MNHPPAGVAASASIAALLSFVVPGLGHAYLGRRREAFVFALPVVILAAALALGLLLNTNSTLGFIITPSGAMTVLVLLLMTMVWRLLAVVDVLRIVRRRNGLSTGPVAFAGLLAVLILAMHLGASSVAYSVYDAGTRIFVGAGADDGDSVSSTPSSSAGTDPSSSATPAPAEEYEVTPEETPATAQSRINILLTGIDSAETRTTSLTDTLLVVSINPVDRSVVMLSLPRDISRFELYDGRTFNGKINSLMTWVRNHPADFDEKPFPALMKEVGFIIGVPIHYFAAVDLQGFRRMVDIVGGVTVDNPRAINDPRYDWLDGTHGFYLSAGKVKLDGRTALAYARSRQGVGDSDFTRAARQQQLLVALRDKLTSPEMLPRLTDIIQAAGDTVRTNLPTDRMDEFIALAREVDPKSIQRFVLGPPYAFHPPTSSTGGVYTLQLDMTKVTQLSRKLFGADSRYARDQ